jgi:hypothetical protein
VRPIARPAKPEGAKETLENQRHPRENGAVTAGQYWIDGR